VQLTVAICTYNPHRDTLVRALDAVVAQLDAGLPAEVIVVDNNSSPPLTEWAYLGHYPLRVICEPKPGLTAARQAAIENASGPIIVFVDDDNILHEEYLANVVKAFGSDPDLGLLGGRVVPEYECCPPEWFAEFEHWLAVRRHSPELHVETTAPPFSSYFPVGAGIAVRRDLALAYLEDCSRTSRIEGRRGDVLTSGEDLDLGLFVLSQNAKLAVSGALSLTHVIATARVSSEYMERLAVGNVKSSMALERKWAPRFGHSIYPGFGISLISLLVRASVTRLLSIWAPRYKIKYRIYSTLTRVRLGETTRLFTPKYRNQEP
jgi:glycosyltransferase involved in cell wall biosynthesis